MIWRKLRRDDRGAAAVEMALTLPVLLLMIYGIFEIGIIMAADAGMQHALGEGARYATLYPTPTDAQIKTRVQNKVFGIHVGTFAVADPTGNTSYKDLSVSYTVTPNFLFFNGPAITLNRTKRVYLSF
jgi:Flp pilus assembly protein TadG